VGLLSKRILSGKTIATSDEVLISDDVPEEMSKLIKIVLSGTLE